MNASLTVHFTRVNIARMFTRRLDPDPRATRIPQMVRLHGIAFGSRMVACARGLLPWIARCSFSNAHQTPDNKNTIP